MKVHNLTLTDAAAHATLFAAARQTIDRYIEYIDHGKAQDVARLQAASDSVPGLQAMVNAATQQTALSQEKPIAIIDDQLMMIGQALGDILAWFGVIRKDVALTGPELLMAAQDLVNSPSPLAEQERFSSKEVTTSAG